MKYTFEVELPYEVGDEVEYYASTMGLGLCLAEKVKVIKVKGNAFGVSVLVEKENGERVFTSINSIKNPKEEG